MKKLKILFIISFIFLQICGVGIFFLDFKPIGQFTFYIIYVINLLVFLASCYYFFTGRLYPFKNVSDSSEDEVNKTKIKRHDYVGTIISSEEEIKEFQRYAYKNLKIEYPLEYLKRAKIRVFKDQVGFISGGYALVSKGELRSISPIDQESMAPYQELKLFEINCLWLRPKVKSGLLSCCFWYRVSRDVSSYIDFDYLVFTYEYQKEKLDELYKLSRSKVIYRGPVKPIKGMKDISYESVQLCDHKKIKYLPCYALSHFLKRLMTKSSLLELFSLRWVIK